MGERVEEIVKRLKVPGKYIGYGEALIYRVESERRSKVWKIYPGFSLSTIEKYQALTAIAANYANGRLWKISTSDKSIEFPFIWKVIPIDQVIEYQGYPLAISEWINGPSVQDLLDRNNRFGGLKHPLQRIEAADYQSVSGSMSQFCEQLNRDLVISHVWFTTVNTKPQGNQIRVTDICPSVYNLQSSEN